MLRLLKTILKRSDVVSHAVQCINTFEILQGRSRSHALSAVSDQIV